MKIKIVGNGELAHNYLTIGKVYDVIHCKTAVDTLDDQGDEITVNIHSKQDCGFLYDATGDLHWEIVEE